MDCISDNSWPKISIIAPSYNQGEFIEGSIRSVLSQGYPNLEYIIMDGSSTDNTLDVIKKYESRITYWASKKKRCQSYLINEGFRFATGEIVNWLCTDDLLSPQALFVVGRYFAELPEIDILVGCSRYVYLNQDRKPWIFKPRPIDIIPAAYAFAQPSCFYRKKLLDRPNPVDESYDYTMDLELWTYFRSKGVRWKIIDDILSVTQASGKNKSSTGRVKITHEAERVYKTYVKEPVPLTFWHRLLRYPLERFLARHPNPLSWMLIAPIWSFLALLLGVFYGFKKAYFMRWKAWA